MHNTASVVLGSQWGDEGKGKLVDILAQSADVCARAQGGNNAGHTIVVNGVKFDFHLLPSGLINPKCVSLIGNGVVVHLPSFFEEVAKTESKGISCEGRYLLSYRAVIDGCSMCIRDISILERFCVYTDVNGSHIVFDVHQIIDGLKEGELQHSGGKDLGTTRKGIGPTYSSKASRSGLRICDLAHPDEFEQKLRQIAANKKKRYGEFVYDLEAEVALYRSYQTRLAPYIIDSITYLHNAIKEGKSVLIEGANALMLDLDFGTYPYVTSSNTGIGGALTGLGIPPKLVGKVYGVVKAYTTRVGAGPFPTEQLNEIGESLQNIGQEWGVTTGRKRRCGWLDTVVLNYSHQINGYSSLNLTKLDVLDTLKTIKIGVAYMHKRARLESFPADLVILGEVEVVYETLPGWQVDISKIKKFEDLPENCIKYVKRVEELVGVEVEFIGVGPGRDAMIKRDL